MTITKGMLKEFQRPLRPQDLTADEHSQMRGITEKTIAIYDFLIHKNLAQEGFHEKEDAAMVTYYRPCRLKKSLAVGGQPTEDNHATARQAQKDLRPGL